MLRWCALDSLPLPVLLFFHRRHQKQSASRTLDHMAAADGPHMRAIGRLAESEGPVLFARFDEAEKCEFIEANVPVEAWSPTDDNAGVLIKANALREQAREVLFSASLSITSS